jgi:glycosyltransferase involved in cell wall biosynthesis
MDEQQRQNVTFSFVVGVRDEADGLEHFYGRLKVVADELGEPYEIVFVDDGSTDESASVIAALAKMDDRVRAVGLSRGFGPEAAMAAGGDYAAGRAVIWLGADGRHPPELIPQLVARWREGFEVVVTVRRDEEEGSPIRRGIRRLAGGLIRLASGADLADQADFRLLDHKAVDALRAHRERVPLARGLVHRIGFRRATVGYHAAGRDAAEGGRTLRELAHVLAAGVFGFSSLPLRVAPVVGGLLLAGAMLYALVAVVLWPLGLAPGGWVSMTVAMAGLFGIQFILLGILGEYVGRTLEEARRRPPYIVRETIGFDEAAAVDAEEQPAEAVEGGEDDSGYVVYT